MEKTEITCNVCGKKGSKKHINSSKHTSTSYHQKALKGEPVRTEEQEKVHRYYINTLHNKAVREGRKTDIPKMKTKTTEEPKKELPKTTTPAPSETKKWVVKEKTVNINTKRVSNLYKLMYGEDWDGNLDFLQDIKKIKNFIMSNPSWKAETTKRNQFSAIASILRDIVEYKDYYDKYSKITTNMAFSIIEENKKNKLKEGEEIPSWNTIIESKSTTATPLDNLIFKLYTEIPPRRAQDYSRLKLEWGSRNFLPVEDENYIVIFKKGKTVYLYIDSYKGKAREKYGTFKKQLGSSELGRLFREYCKDRTQGDYLFLNKELDLEQRDKNFSALVKQSFSKFGLDLTINKIRKSYASSWINNKISEKQKEKLAFEMGTSLNTIRESYSKTDLMKK
jgi:hypothetical protein